MVLAKFILTKTFFTIPGKYTVSSKKRPYNFYIPLYFKGFLQG